MEAHHKNRVFFASLQELGVCHGSSRGLVRTNQHQIFLLFCLDRLPDERKAVSLIAGGVAVQFSCFMSALLSLHRAVEYEPRSGSVRQLCLVPLRAHIANGTSYHNLDENTHDL